MGLSASQARLLTITARKSDCEYESMRLSHQKLALSRDMNNLSNEYQNALEQTKLMYDFYGNGSEEQPLTYGLLMSPSALNDYIPKMISDTSGRFVLNSKLAAAAKAAGIPQEGLNGLPSSDVRNNFISELAAQEVITEQRAETIKKIPYNQGLGLGNSDVVNIITAECTYDELLKMVDNIKFDLTDLVASTGGSNLDIYLNGAHCEDTDTEVRNMSLKDLLTGNIRLSGNCSDNKKLKENGYYTWSVIDKVANSTLWDQIRDGFGSLLDTGDGTSGAALDYAYQKIIERIETFGTTEEEATSNKALQVSDRKKHRAATVLKEVNNEVDKYIGYVWGVNDDNDAYNFGYGLNLTNMTKAFLTYFAQYMQGFGNSDYNVTKDPNTSTLVGNEFTFTYLADVDTTGDNVMLAGFYDSMLNQICISGWTENDNVNDKDYLREMLQNGAVYISQISDDGYYYQDNYSTNNYIKEVADEQYIAQAEAKYTREKEKLNHKENIIDMKMKNLDTEISALTTEYDTIKAVITKNIEKSFKRYSA